MGAKRDKKRSSSPSAAAAVAATIKDVDVATPHEPPKYDSWSEWLQSPDGVGWMQLFVVTNAVVLLVTTGLPKIMEAVAIIKTFF